MPRLAPTFFIGIVPPAILAIDIHKLIVASQSGVLRWIDAQTMKSIGFVAILINWGFAFWWFVLSLIIVAHYIRNIQLPYALSWWAFTFPLGALSIASGVVAKVTGCNICQVLFLLVLAIYLGIWSIVTYKTIGNTLSGKVF